MKKLFVFDWVYAEHLHLVTADILALKVLRHSSRAYLKHIFIKFPSLKKTSPSEF